MKKLLKIQVLLLVLFVSSQMSAQSFLIRGGLNLSNTFHTEDFFEVDSRIKGGFHLGGSVILPFNKEFSLDLGLQISNKSYEVELVDLFESISVNYNLYYLEIPMKLRYTRHFEEIGVFGAFGPYVGYGLAGRMKIETKAFGMTTSAEEFDNYFSESENKVDAGLVLEAGIEYQRFLVSLSYTRGLLVQEDLFLGSSQVYGLSLGYKIGS